MHFRGSGSAVRFELCGGVDAWQRVVIQTVLWLGPDGGSGLGPDGKNPLGDSVQMENPLGELTGLVWTLLVVGPYQHYLRTVQMLQFTRG